MKFLINMFINVAAICTVVGIIFSLLVAMDNGIWYDLPVPDNYMQVMATPTLTLHYGFYIAAVGAIVSIVAVVFAWVYACMMCSHIEGVRYQMLNAPLTYEEKGAYAGPGRSYHFETKGGFRYDGYSRPAAEVDF